METTHYNGSIPGTYSCCGIMEHIKCAGYKKSFKVQELNSKRIFLSFFFSFIVALQPFSGLGRLIVEVSRSHRHSTLGRTLLDEWSAGHRDLCLTIHNIHNRQTFMLSVGFEPAIPVSERPQTYAVYKRTVTEYYSLWSIETGMHTIFQTIEHRMKGWLVRKELRRMWK